MDRRNFLAFIPSLSAIPLIGKEIIQEKEKITIIKPEPIPIQAAPEPFDLRKCELVLMQSGREIGRGYLSSLSMEAPINGMMDIQVEGRLFNLSIE